MAQGQRSKCEDAVERSGDGAVAQPWWVHPWRIKVDLLLGQWSIDHPSFWWFLFWINFRTEMPHWANIILSPLKFMMNHSSSWIPNTTHKGNSQNTPSHTLWGLSKNHNIIQNCSRFEVPDISNPDKWANRVVNNLLYYQTNYFISALIIFSLIRFVNITWKINFVLPA